MPETFTELARSLAPTPERPLLGMTVLVVEDSRFASEALRMMCLRSGARIRRADSLRSAHRHLATYRPALAIVDLGLPDGSGLELISELARCGEAAPLILATSGDTGLEGAAREAGAAGFLAKPLESLAVFQKTVAAIVPGAAPRGPRLVTDERIIPDALTMREDYEHAMALLAHAPDPAMLRYLSQFLTGIARSAHDSALEDAARRLDLPGTRRLSGLLQARLARVAGF